MAKRHNPRVFGIHKALYGKPHPDAPADHRQPSHDQFANELAKLVEQFVERGVPLSKLHTLLQVATNTVKRRESEERQEMLTQQVVEAFAQTFISNSLRRLIAEPPPEAVRAAAFASGRSGRVSPFAELSLRARRETDVSESPPDRFGWIGVDFSAMEERVVFDELVTEVGPQPQQHHGANNPHRNRPRSDQHIRGFKRSGR